MLSNSDLLTAVETIRRLESGPLAELRRMKGNTGASAFWWLASRVPDAMSNPNHRRRWIDFVRMVAILTPSGDPADRRSLHERGRNFGMTLCDAGDPRWPGTSQQPRPAFSERRLWRLIASRGEQREVMLTRVARMLARSRAADSGIDVVDLAQIVFKPEDGSRLAEPYYRRLVARDESNSETVSNSTPPSSQGTLESVVLDTLDALRRLEPGSLAELRRMHSNLGASAFWRLAARHPNSIGRLRSRQKWIDIIRIFGILTPKGNPEQRPVLHDRRRKLGTVLCDGGDPKWPGPSTQPSPAFSERRLLQLLASRGDQRGVMLTRAARMLARSRIRSSGINAIDITLAVLKPEESRWIAESYYRRLDSAEFKASKPQKGNT